MSLNIFDVWLEEVDAECQTVILTDFDYNWDKVIYTICRKEQQQTLLFFFFLRCSNYNAN